MPTPFRTAAALAAIALPIAAAPLSLAAQTVPDARSRAAALVTNLAAGEFAAASHDFTARMREALPPGRLAGIWHALVEQAGTFQQVQRYRDEKVPPHKVVVAEAAFAHAAIDIRITFDEADSVAGLFFAPHAAAASTAAWSPPAYADTTRFTEREVSVGSGPLALPATLSMPAGAGPFSAVVLVHGSGPNDRDETIGPNKPFRDLAWGLASRGIAVLRYEKRTRAHPGWFAQHATTFTVNDETVDDAVAAADVLRQAPGIDPRRVIVLGHSLGGTMIPRVGLRDPHLAGLIVMAGATRPLPELIVQQTEYLARLAGDTGAAERERLAALRAQAARADSPGLSTATPATELPFGIAAPYWLDLRGYHPAAEARRLTQPLLILQGARDYQVTMADYDGWRAALDGRRRVTFHLYPALDHLFIAGSGPGTPAAYERPGHVDAAVIADVAAWIAGLPRAAAGR